MSKGSKRRKGDDPKAYREGLPNMKSTKKRYKEKITKIGKTTYRY